jgi:hypothetical protein
MSIQLIPVMSSSNNANTSAGPNSIALRDNTGGLTNQNETVNGQLITNGTFSIQTKTITASQTVDQSAVVWLCNASSGAIVATLPLASTLEGQLYIFKKTDSSGNDVTPTGSGGETIDGASTNVLSSQYAVVRIVSDGTNWNVI